MNCSTGMAAGSGPRTHRSTPGRVMAAIAVAAMLQGAAAGQAADPPASTARGDAQVAAAFAAETAALRGRCIADTADPASWQRVAAARRRELFDMLGIDEDAPRGDLRAVVTGTLDHPDCVVERIHFQSRPGLYVTANLYLPRDATAPAPGILYLCGHARVVEGGRSLGNKTAYQHHGAWLARHGYATLVVDTLQLGEIQGIHHGTYSEGRWWWPSRGYTPAGVEAWNAIRALDYLQTRPEIDPQRLGVTGRSGGGVGSWWIAALDERIRAAVPVAGITDLEDYVVRGVVSGHCDCMFIVNTFRWDYPQVAALVYPRPLLVANTDRDRIFPLDGVLRIHEAARRVYQQHAAANRLQQHTALGLLITAGDHVDTQDLQLPALRWFDRHLRGEDRPIDAAPRKLFEPARLRVFGELPADEANTSIDDTFVPRAGPFTPPASAGAWREQAGAWRAALRDRCFGGWPADEPPVQPTLLERTTSAGLVLETHRFASQPHVDLELFLLRRADGTPETVVLECLDDAGWDRFERLRAAFAAGTIPAADAPDPAGARAFVAPRGVGPTRWNREPRVHVQVRRRFLLLGQTWEGMQAYDIRRALATVRAVPSCAGAAVTLRAAGATAVLAAHASLFGPPVAGLDLRRVPPSHQPDGPSLLNVLRILDVPQVLALAADRAPVVVSESDAAAFAFASATAAALGWPADRLVFLPGTANGAAGPTPE
jgi:dienelactone hydrolase